MSTVRIQVRRGTAAQWTAADPVLEAGEIGFESDTNKFKFGNGDDAWSVLTYAAPGFTDFQNTLDDYLTVGLRGTANGVASLNSSTKIPNEQIDSSTWATRSLVRATVSGLQLHENVTYATTEALTATYAAGTTDWFGGTAIGARLTLNATGVLTVDGVAMPAGARILVKDQSTKLHNGLYTVTTAGATGVAAVLTRTDDASDEFSPALYGGSIFYVQLGSSNAGKQFVQLTKGTAANKGIVVGTDNIDWTQYSGAATLTAGTGITINGDTITVNDSVFQLKVAGVTDTEIGYLDGVTSGIQSQLNDKAPLASPTFTGTVTLPSQTVTSQMILNGTIVEEDISDQAITSAKIANGTIVNTDISASTAIDWTKIAPSSTVSETELGYLDGVTSAIQTQINTKAPSANPTFTGTVSGVTKAMVGLGDVDNTADSAKPVSTATQTALDAKAALAGPTFTGTVTVPTLAVTTTATGITKTMVGLANVDNTTDANKPVSTATQTALDAKLALSGGTLTGALTLSGAPTSDLHAATKLYVDGIAAGINFHQPVVAATSGNLAGTYNNGTGGVGATITAASNGSIGTIDGVTVSVGNRILLRAQTDAKQNGVYTVTAVGSAGAPYVVTRATDADNNPSGELATGDFTFVTSGSTNGSRGFICSTTGTITIGTTDVNYTVFNASEAVTAGTNITKSGSTISVSDAPTFSGLVTASATGVAFSDGTQTREGVPSRTPIIQKTASYTLSDLAERDDLIEIASASATTLTIPADATLNFPIGTSLDILQTSTGQVTIAGAGGVTVNATPGLKLRTQWSSATLFKRAANTWVVIGDLSA
jgi:hypothetical protein